MVKFWPHLNPTFHLLWSSWPGLRSVFIPQILNSQSHNHSHSEHMTTTPNRTLNAGGNETVKVCSGHSTTLLEDNFALFPPQIFNTPSSIWTLTSRFGFILQWENRYNQKRMSSTPTYLDLPEPWAYPLTFLLLLWTIFHAPKIKPSTSALGPVPFHLHWNTRVASLTYPSCLINQLSICTGPLLFSI